MNHMSHLMTKWLCAQQRLTLAWASAQSLLCAQWVVKDPSFLHADSEDSDQTGWMPRLIWDFAGCTCHLVGFVMRWLIIYCLFSCRYIPAMSWQNLFMPNVNNKNVASVLLAPKIDYAVIDAISKISRLKLPSTTEQVGLSRTWSHIC